MEKDGVDAEIIFGILGVASRLEDHEAANEMLRIYNDFLKDFCSHYPDRQIGLACLPYGDIDAAVKEVYRVAKLGLRGLELSCSWDMEPMWHPMWEPLWKAVSDVQLPLHFHTFPAIPRRVRDAACRPHMRRQAQFTTVAGFQMNLINIIAAIIGAGVLERYPNMRVGFGESGIGWLPYALDRMDFEFEDRFRDLMKLKPSRILAPPVPRDVPVRPDRPEADRGDGRRDPDVGLRLPAPGRRLAGKLRNTSRSSSPACRPTRSTRSPARTPRSSTGWSTDRMTARRTARDGHPGEQAGIHACRPSPTRR